METPKKTKKSSKVSKRVNPRKSLDPKDWKGSIQGKDKLYTKYVKGNVIYSYRCVVTQKRYIGRTSDPWKRKQNHHSLGGKTNRPMYEDMSKYGIEKFVFELLEEDVPEEDIGKRERFYIDKYNTLIPNGYNLKKTISNAVRGKRGSLSDYYGKVDKVTAAPIKKNGVDNFIRLELYMKDGEKIRWDYGQEVRGMTYEKCVTDIDAILADFKRHGAIIKIDPQITHKNDPLAKYIPDIEKFKSLNVRKITITSTCFDKKCNKYKITLNLKSKKKTYTKGFVGKTITEEQSYKNALAVAKRIVAEKRIKDKVTLTFETSESNR